MRHLGFRRYLANTTWLFAGQMTSMVIAFFVGSWVARHLGPTEYGKYSFALSFAGLFTFLSNLGIGTILNRDLAEKKDEAHILLGTGSVLLFGASLLTALASVTGIFLTETDPELRTLVTLYSLTFLWSPLGLISSFFLSRVQAKETIKASLITAIIASLVKVAAVSLDASIIAFMVILVAENLSGMLLSLYYYTISGNKIQEWTFNKKTAFYLLKSGWLMMFGAAASYLLQKIDQVMVKYMLSDQAVGQYAAATRLIEIWYFIPGMICASLLPALLNAKRTSIELYKKRLRLLYLLLGSIALVLSLGTTIFAKLIITLLFGVAYTPSIGVLVIYAWSSIGLYVLWGIQQQLLAENKLFVIFGTYLTAALINIVLNLILIPRTELTGAAWATLISYSLAPAIALLLTRFTKNHNQHAH